MQFYSAEGHTAGPHNLIRGIVQNFPKQRSFVVLKNQASKYLIVTKKFVLHFFRTWLCVLTVACVVQTGLVQRDGRGGGATCRTSVPSSHQLGGFDIRVRCVK